MLLVERGLAESRQKAQALILAGEVSRRRPRSDKAGSQLPAMRPHRSRRTPARYASRAGTKLEGALEDFGVALAGKICLDVGASTGGFTDCLLQHGAQRVFAVDVTASQMAWKLQQRSARRADREERALSAAGRFSGSRRLVTVDVSFISVAKILPR